MHLSVDLLVVGFPDVCEDGHPLSKGYVFELTNRQFKSILVLPDARQQEAPLLEEVVLWDQFKDLVCDVQVTPLQEQLHSLFQVLDGATCLHFSQV